MCIMGNNSDPIFNEDTQYLSTIDLPKENSYDTIANITIRNHTGMTIGVLYQDGNIHRISSNTRSVNPNDRKVVITITHFASSDMRANHVEYISNTKCNQIVKTIKLSQFASHPISVIEAGIVIAIEDNIHVLTAMSNDHNSVIDKIVMALERRFFYMSRTNNDNFAPDGCPIVIFANEHADVHKQIYVDLNDIACSVNVIHDKSIGEGVYMLIRNADGTVYSKHLDDWSWGRSAIYRTTFLDHEWIIGTSKNDVITAIQKRAIENKTKRSPDDVELAIKRATIDKDEQIKKLKEDNEFITGVKQRLERELKEANAKVDAAESKTEATLKQQAAYASFYTNQQKQEYESRQQEAQYRFKQEQMELERRKQERSELTEIIKTIASVVGAVVSVATAIFAIVKVSK